MTPTDMSLEILNFIETKKNFFVGSSTAAASTELYGLTYRVKLKVWLYTLPGPVLGAEITSASLLRELKSENNGNPYAVVALSVDTNSTGRSFPVMAQSAIDKIPPDPKLDALAAEKVFGWRNVHQHEGTLVGKKQEGRRWRLAKVPYYSTNPVHAFQ